MPTASRLKLGELASPVTVRSDSSTLSQRAPFGSGSSVAGCPTKPAESSLFLRTTARAIACPFAVSSFRGSPSAPSAGAARSSANSDTSTTRTIPLYSRLSGHRTPAQPAVRFRDLPARPAKPDARGFAAPVPRQAERTLAGEYRQATG